MACRLLATYRRLLRRLYHWIHAGAMWRRHGEKERGAAEVEDPLLAELKLRALQAQHQLVPWDASHVVHPRQPHLCLELPHKADEDQHQGRGKAVLHQGGRLAEEVLLAVDGHQPVASPHAHPRGLSAFAETSDDDVVPAATPEDYILLGGLAIAVDDQSANRTAPPLPHLPLLLLLLEEVAGKRPCAVQCSAAARHGAKVGLLAARAQARRSLRLRRRTVRPDSPFRGVFLGMPTKVGLLGGHLR
mmetsp:Transcript_43803/g.126628  ORF Transcript_43803/g.126628 Transcript_43803/m.126628 type:complete len:246 (+) Transcript_43803:216-953(+)